MNVSMFFIFLAVVIVFVVIVAARNANAGRGGGGGPQIPQACPQCGEANPGQATFCRKCGRALR